MAFVEADAASGGTARAFPLVLPAGAETFRCVLPAPTRPELRRAALPLAGGRGATVAPLFEAPPLEAALLVAPLPLLGAALLEALLFAAPRVVAVVRATR